MEELRRSVGLRAYGQKDPLSEYKGEAFRFFEELMDSVRLQICTGLFRTATNRLAFENMLSVLSRTLRMEGPADAPAAPTRPVVSVSSNPGEPAPAGAPEVKLPTVTIKRDAPKVGRNDPCPCGSGKKFKHCHGK
jgi:preprotein translocase subunit SecA